MKTSTKLLLFLTFVWLLPSCATKKKRDDVSALGKFYHNTTAEFNGYYNANVLLTESIDKLNLQHEENYTKILDVYKYAAAPNPQALAPDLDKAIQKVSVVISLHRKSHWTDDCYLIMGKCQYLKRDFETAEETFKYMVEEFPTDGPAKKVKKTKKEKQKEAKQVAKEKEKVREQTRKDRIKEAKRKKKEREKLIKQRRKNQKKGIKTPVTPKPTESVKAETPDQKTIKEEEKKQEETAEKEQPSDKPENYFLKHRPAAQEGQLWFARTLVERGKYEIAERIFIALQTDPRTFKDIKADLAPAMAHSYLKQKKYDLAIPQLENAIKLSKDKPSKARYAYILAQLHSRAGRNADAFAWYQKVIKYRPKYDMEFSARLQMAQNAYASGKSSRDDIVRDLNKMLKDDKNREYKDQIYYTLAQIALQNNDEIAAIENLELSLKFNVDNIVQKTESYYQLATLYFEKERYVKAKSYFDSTLLVISANDERYKSVQKLSSNLTEIAENIQTIELQDSLLLISKMSDEDKKALALEIKKRQEEEREKAAQIAALNQQQVDNSKSGQKPSPLLKNSLPLASMKGVTDDVGKAAGGISGGNVAVGKFFAYDDKAIRRGKKEFQKKWGTRPLVDNWRLSSKIEAVLSPENTQADSTTTKGTGITDQEIENILADVPSNASEIAAANKIIEDALFELGRLFREKLENHQKSVESLEKLLSRYPETTHRPEAYYLLYLGYTELGNSTKAREYYNLITSEFPESLFARVLLNPDFYKETQDKQLQLNQYYDQAYVAFTKGRYEVAFEQVTKSDSLFGSNNPFRARFALLKAMCLGNLSGKEAYVDALKDIVAKYPDQPEQKRAKEILRLLGDESQSSGINDGENNEAVGIDGEGDFKAEHNDVHYIIIVLPENADLNKAKSQIGDFHRQYFNLDNLRISNIFLGDDKNKTPLLVVRRFDNKEASMRYFDSANKNSTSFLSKDFNYRIYPITQNNYRQILKQRSINGYAEFFQQNYLN